MQIDSHVRNILQQYFGFTSFKKGQEEIIKTILNGKDVLGIMPTGAGKSLCYQVPALVFKGTTIVISPLISLMKDQVDALAQVGARAAFINSSLSREELQSITGKAHTGDYKLIYVAPERLELESFQAILRTMETALVAVDEAHCVSQWGHDFRPSYRKIAAMLAKLPERPPVAAFTATATPRVKDDIISMLKLRQPNVLVTGFDRENLYYEVEKPDDKFDYLSSFLNNYSKSSGIIYCSTRKTVDNLSDKLKKMGYLCTSYHAGLSEKERLLNQEAFIYDQSQIIIATVAFGMGIDKSNIRYVLHYNMPKTLENYYQEAGRAGRDGEAAQCILLYSPADIITNKFLIEKGGLYGRSDDYKKLQEMIDYCHTGSCLRRYILNYFGEGYVPEECGNCGNCLNTVEHTDITVEAQKILSCIKRTGERFGSGLVTDVLRGAKTARIKELEFDKLSTFGLMPEYSKSSINEIIAYLAAQGLIGIKGGQYPILSLKHSAYSWLKSGGQLTIKQLIRKEQSLKTKKRRDKKTEAQDGSGLELDRESQLLFEKMRVLRKDIAAAQNVPPFVVFSDATLRDICRKLPSSKTALLNISGIGKYKLEKYGAQFLAVIREHLQRDSNIYPDASG